MFTEKLAGTKRGLCGDKCAGDRGHFKRLRVESPWLRANGGLAAGGVHFGNNKENVVGNGEVDPVDKAVLAG